MNNQNKLVLLLLIGLFIINFLISDNFNYDGKVVAVFAQETAGGQFSTYTNEKYNITMQYPSDWTKDEGEGEVEDDGITDIVSFYKDIDALKDSNASLFLSGVSLVINPNQNIPLQEYLSNTIEAYEEGSDPSSSTCSPSSSNICASDFEILSSANTDQTLAGHPAYILEYIHAYPLDYTQNLTSKVDETVRYLEIGAKIGNDYYFVVYYANEGDNYDESLLIAKKMIDSIKIDSS